MFSIVRCANFTLIPYVCNIIFKLKNVFEHFFISVTLKKDFNFNYFIDQIKINLVSLLSAKRTTKTCNNGNLGYMGSIYYRSSRSL